MRTQNTRAQRGLNGLHLRPDAVYWRLSRLSTLPWKLSYTWHLRVLTQMSGTSVGAPSGHVSVSSPAELADMLLLLPTVCRSRQCRIGTRTSILSSVTFCSFIFCQLQLQPLVPSAVGTILTDGWGNPRSQLHQETRGFVSGSGTD
jgi:hypothetical protein